MSTTSRTQQSGRRSESGSEDRRYPWRRPAILGATLAIVLAGGRYAYWEQVERCFQPITAGVLYKSGAMEPPVLLDKVEAHGIRSVVDLRNEPDDALEPERQVLDAAGVTYLALPTEQVPELEVVDRFLAFMDDPRNQPVLVHCRHGWGRSVLFSALYRIEFEGWENERARRGTRRFAWRGSFKRGSPKGEFLRSYVKRCDR